MTANTDSESQVAFEANTTGGVAERGRASARPTRALRGERTDRPLPPTNIDNRYDVRRELGAGGFGTVYLAHDRILDREVALKLLNRTEGEDAQLFRREIGILRMLRLPGVVELLTDGIHDGHLYFVASVVDGVPFPGKARSWRQLEHIAIGLLETLDRVHAHGILHRDLKPGNVLVRPNGNPVLLDFGVSLAFDRVWDDHARGAAMGTPLYMAPELLAGYEASPSGDLYALGVMLYEALTDTPAFAVESIRDLRDAKEQPLVVDPSKVDAPPAVCELIAELTAPFPKDRPRSAEEVLKRLQADAPLVAVLPTLVGRVEPLSAEELRSVFHGPETGFHLPTDAAIALHTRTDGDPAKVSRELNAWIRAGLCYRDDAKMRITREAIERLEHGLTLSRRPGLRHRSASMSGPRPMPAPPVGVGTADTQPPTMSNGGHVQWSGATLDKTQAAPVRLPAHDPQPTGDRERICREVDRARTARRNGRASIGYAMADGALGLARSTGDEAGELVALQELVLNAIVNHTAARFDLVLWELSRVGQRTRFVSALEELTRQTRDGRLHGHRYDSLAERRTIPAFDDLELELYRRALLASAVWYGGDDATAERVLADNDAWALTCNDERVVATVATWGSTYHYHRGRFDIAWELAELGAENGLNVVGRLAARSNGVSALIELRRYDEALEHAEAGIEICADLRLPILELRFLCQAEQLAYRLGRSRPTPPDVDVAMSMVDNAWILANWLLTKAADAWRRGDTACTLEYANAAYDSYVAIGFSGGMVISWALAIATGRSATPNERTTHLAKLHDIPPGLAVQALALLRSAGVAFEADVPAWTPPRPDLRAEILSPSEAAELLGLRA